MRISDWSSDVCSSDLYDAKASNDVSERRQSRPCWDAARVWPSVQLRSHSFELVDSRPDLAGSALRVVAIYQDSEAKLEHKGKLVVRHPWRSENKRVNVVCQLGYRALVRVRSGVV